MYREHHTSSRLTKLSGLGAYLTGVGLLFSVLGVFLFFNRTFLALGNVCSQPPLADLIAPLSYWCYYGDGIQQDKELSVQPKVCHKSQSSNSLLVRKIAGTVCFLLGLITILSGWTFIGLLLEGFGFVNLFMYVVGPHVCYSLLGQKLLSTSIASRQIYPCA